MESIGKLNATIYRSLQSILNFKLEDMPIQSGQHDFFYVISKNEGITQKELSEHLLSTVFISVLRTKTMGR